MKKTEKTHGEMGPYENKEYITYLKERTVIILSYFCTRMHHGEICDNMREYVVYSRLYDTLIGEIKEAAIRESYLDMEKAIWRAKEHCGKSVDRELELWEEKRGYLNKGWNLK